MSISSGIVTTTFEHIVVTDQSRSILFIVIYRPPPSKVNKLKLSDYLVEIDNFIGETAQLPGKHIYLGDFNIHMNEPTKSHVAKFINILSCNNLQNYVTGPTHKSGNQLDLVIGNVDDNLVMNCKTHQNLMSDDHYSVFFKLNRKKPDMPRTYTSCRDFRTVDIDQLMMDLTTELASLMSIMNVDEQVQFYDATVCDVLDRYCPIQSRNRTIRPRVPWYNDDIHLARRVKRRLERRWRKSKLDTDREAYVVQLGVLSELIHSAKASYFTDKLSSGNVKDTFKTINTLLNTTRNNLPVGESGKPLGDKFALSFKGKIVNIRNELDATSGIGDLTAFGFHDVPVNCELSSFASADHDEISEIIVRAPNKTCSLDSMPTWLLKTYVHDMVQFVSHIVNTSISTGVFPDSLRRAIFTPILKKSNLDQNNLSNYRPVSNIPFLSKVIEKVVSRRLDSYIMENSLEQPFQSAYRGNHSTETAILRVKNDIMHEIDNNRAVYLVLLDLSAAFDTIDHDLLTSRLATSYGLRGLVLNWFDSYLKNRTNRVSISGTLSDEQSVDFGVPQGSVVGPLIFTFYTKPVADIITHHHLRYHVYADDTQLYTAFDPSVP
ncbi:uncharacterized protein [Amphiura filiformis]|uniref:uncharacterized protein n=1 Tax=Amphiura filiformis TaxID=82378 RepID=UPI003B2264D4